MSDRVDPATPARFIGGPFGGARTTLTRTPPYVVIRGTRYERIDDPDTGEYLGGYAAEFKEAHDG